jgi:hypothetical protein
MGVARKNGCPETSNRQQQQGRTQHAQDAKTDPHREYISSSSPATTPDVLSSTPGIDLGFDILKKLTAAM